MAEAASGPFTATAEGVRVALRLQPGARGSGIEGADRLSDGRVVLKARVGAVPDDGKANAALIKLLAKTWRLPKGAVRLVAGRTSRLKTLEVSGDPEDTLARLTAWLAAQAGGAPH